MALSINLLCDEGLANQYPEALIERWRDVVLEIGGDHDRSWAWLNVVIMKDEAHTSLNNKYLGHNYSTDILTFDMSDSDLIQGEIYINESVLIENAVEYEVETNEELDRLVVHGVLHLCGKNDETELEKVEMRRQEDHYLAKMTG